MFNLCVSIFGQISDNRNLVASRKTTPHIIDIDDETIPVELLTRADTISDPED